MGPGAARFDLREGRSQPVDRVYAHTASLRTFVARWLSVPSGPVTGISSQEDAAALGSVVTSGAMDADPREELKRLVDRLPEPVVPAALRMVAELATGRDQFLTHVLAAEEDDEELNEVGRRMLAEAREDSEAGRTHTLREVEMELGL